MDGLIELIFENVPDDSVDRLVYDLLQGAGILEISHSELGRLEQKLVDQDLMSFLMKEAEPASIFVRAACVTVGGIPIRSPLIRILRFEGSNEVAVIFESVDISSTDRLGAVRKLAAGANVLASGANVPDYYCGFEPATDEVTRLFSRDAIGPLVEV